MSFPAGILGPATPRVTTRTSRCDDYDSSSSTDSAVPSRRTANSHRRYRQPFTAASSSSGQNFLFPPFAQSSRSSRSSTAASTPLQSRPPSPFPQFFSSNPSSSCTSDTDTEPDSPVPQAQGSHAWRQDRRSWWMIGSSSRRRRRKRNGRYVRAIKKWWRRISRHPLFPRQPITIVLTLLLLSVFAVFLTLLLIYILNPDKEPLPWRAYCSTDAPSSPPDSLVSASSTLNSLRLTPISPPSPFPPPNFDTLPPAGVFVGVFSVDSAFERRMLVRTTWASHPRSRVGADESDKGMGTSRTIVRFILGQPRKEWDRRILLEMQAYNDIIVLPVSENMNSGKTHSFFSWASLNAWVPPIYDTSLIPPQFSYSNSTSSATPLAPHDSSHAWNDHATGQPRPWSRPDFVVKVDDDSFVMLAELEARLRLELHIRPHSHSDDLPHHFSSPLGSRDLPSATTNVSIEISSPHQSHLYAIPSTPSRDPLVYWGYLVKNRFMAGELYGLSWSLVNWVGNDPVVKGMTRGAEDKQTAKWVKLHPRASEVRWTSERCWMYDHPRSGTVYSHGFLFPSEVTRVRQSMMSAFDKLPQEVLYAGTLSSSQIPSSWAYSSVSAFGLRYTPPVPDLTILQSVEALVEGSDMSKLREGSPMTPEHAWQHREGRAKRYEKKRVGGTVVVHFIKKNMWFLETAMALLEGDEYSESERYSKRPLERTTSMGSAYISATHSDLSNSMSKQLRR